MAAVNVIEPNAGRDTAGAVWGGITTPDDGPATKSVAPRPLSNPPAPASKKSVPVVPRSGDPADDTVACGAGPF